MNIILYLITFILPIVSVKQQVKPKLCIHCKYFIPDNEFIKYSKCSFFQKNDIDFLVNGISKENYHYCCVSREIENMCGKEGKYYKKKIVKNEENEKNI
jgi:hypothetical protein